MLLYTQELTPPDTHGGNFPARILPWMVRNDLACLSFAAIVVGVAFFLLGLWGSDGHIAPPIDDTFIHLQYARQLAAGYPFQYNTGDLPSSGDSSFIFPFLLAPAFLLGMNGVTPLLYSYVLGMFAHVIAVVLLYKLALRLFNRPVAIATAIFFILDGRVNWGFASGMETGVYTAALLGFLYAWVKYATVGRYGLISLTGTLLALLRPEGHIIVAAICFITFIWMLGSRKFRPSALWLTLPILAGLLPYAVNIALTGYWQFNTAASKSLLYIPHLPLRQELSIIAGYFITMTKDVYLGLEIGRAPFVIFTIPLFMIGLALGKQKGQQAILHVPIIAALLLGTGLAMLLPPAHFYRYYQPYDFIVFLYFSAGLMWCINQARRHFAGTVEQSAGTSRRWYGWGIGTISILMLPQLVSFIFIIGDSTRDIYYQQMAFSEWIRRYTPKDARIGVNDVGAHKYLSERYVLDLVGLTDNRLRSVHFSGWGSIFDVLMSMPEKERPQYFLIHPDVAINNVAESVSQSLLTPQYSISIQNPIVSAGPVETLYKVNWEYALLDQAPTYLLYKDKQPLDTLNIGDLADEAKHSYKIEGRQAGIIEPGSFVTTGSYEDKGESLSESGRRHSGWEQFVVKSTPGKPLILVSRSLLNPGASQKLLVLANDGEVGLWTFQNDTRKTWQEYEYMIPAEFITGTTTTIRIDSTFDPGAANFASYRYWTFTP